MTCQKRRPVILKITKDSRNLQGPNFHGPDPGLSEQHSPPVWVADWETLALVQLFHCRV